MSLDLSPPPRSFTHRERTSIIIGLMVSMFLAALDQTIVATALPRMAAELHGTVPLSWVVASYLLSATAVTPIYGKLSDLYGRRPLLMIAIIGFLFGSLLCGFAHSMTQLVLYRAIQGIGGGGILSLVHTTIADVVSPRERGRYQAYFSSNYAAASVSGPVLGGLFADHLGWQWVFWINIPIGLFALWLLNRLLKGLTAKRIRHRIDFLGASLIVCAVCAVLLLMTLGGNGESWTSPRMIMLTALALILAGAAILQERRADEPILPPRLFANPVYKVTMVSCLLTSLVMIGASVFVPLLLQLVLGLSAQNSGLMLIPLSGAVVVGATFAGRFVSTTGRYKMLPLVGTVINAAGLLLLSFSTNVTSLWLIAVEMMLLSVGNGLCLPVQLVAVQNAVEPRDLGAATATVNLFRSMGGSFGVTFFGALLIGGLDARLMQAGIGQQLGPHPASALIHGGSYIITQFPEALRSMVMALTAQSFRTVFQLGACVSLLNFMVQLFLPEWPLSLTSGIEARLAADAESCPQ